MSIDKKRNKLRQSYANQILQHEDSSHIRQKHYQKHILPGKGRTGTSAHRPQAHSGRIWKISHEKHTPLCRCQAKFLTSRHVRMHRMVFYISNTLRKLMI